MSPLVFLRVKVKGEPLHLCVGKAKGDAGKVTPGQPLVQLPSSGPDCEVRSCDVGCMHKNKALTPFIMTHSN